jgi:hypothetical protein
MPRQEGKSDFEMKYGNRARTALEKAKKAETVYSSGGNLPPGIEAGVARIYECKVDTFKTGDNKGQLFFFASGIVKRPKAINGIPVEGLHTRIRPEPLCDTPNARGEKARRTLEEHVNWAVNMLRLLGLNTAQFDGSLEDMCNAVKSARPYFRFRTWQGQPSKEFPDPRVNETWLGHCEFTAEEDDVADDVDEPSSDYEPDVTEEKEDEGAGEPNEEDLGSLAARADNGDNEAAAELRQKAIAAGVEESAADEAESWGAVVEMMRELGEGNIDSRENGESEEDGSWEPEKESVYGFRPPRARKPVDCSVTAVFHGKRTVNLRDLDDGKTYKGVPWDRLIRNEAASNPY